MGFGDYDKITSKNVKFSKVMWDVTQVKEKRFI